MNLKDVQSHLDKINSQKFGPDNYVDDEACHIYQDEMYEAVLEAIAEDKCEDSPKELAKLALEVRNMNFSRWYA